MMNEGILMKEYWKKIYFGTMHIAHTQNYQNLACMNYDNGDVNAAIHETISKDIPKWW